MKLKFEHLKLSENRDYYGVIERVSVKEKKSRIQIFVVLEEVPNESFMQSLPLSLHTHSQLAMFLEEMQILNRKDEAELDDLIGKNVSVRLNLAKDGNYYIRRMRLVLDNSDEYEEDEYEEDEYEEDEYEEDEYEEDEVE